MQHFEVDTVAMVTVGGVERRAIYDGDVWWAVNVTRPQNIQCYNSNEVESVRPLAVIDPNDGDGIERFVGLYWKYGEYAEALEQFANGEGVQVQVAEPQGKGAVVRADDGTIWQRVEKFAGRPWADFTEGLVIHEDWSYVNVSDDNQVLYEGVYSE